MGQKKKIAKGLCDKCALKDKCEYESINEGEVVLKCMDFMESDSGEKK